MRITADNHNAVSYVDRERIFSFPQGIPGFESVKKYVYLINDSILPFFYMQSLHRSNISFVCVDPFTIFDGYQARISKENVDFLELEKPSDALVLNLVTVCQ